ncbi:Uncharacterized protein ALO80_01564 [Pseudomonas caricapapayae]|uniref:Uncharacterized protein n=1 Tax=Pseudomonas caricapapayae TaxID=46678 RepID=A0A0P9LYN7_9PSED|nr:hypothetical protein [Pseudomonas caricapapayae]KAA8698033.1 hypothetical protein F4W67_04065 [Pseudomonas caricapapayae]KPW60261.1 Uncharacterized protein ALO80_01564 [Pseudomonas caricapapayae]RMM09756.1 hypothetical protein ALQ84_03774 [Pseudomonas caricapapayae]RMV92403.1 hypothetical protein ALP01_04005 [Pseudomonas caricapapayae]
MTDSSQQQFRSVWATLQSLRKGIGDLQLSELERVESLRCHQTVDDREVIQQSFDALEQSINEIEITLASIGEATGETGKF